MGSFYQDSENRRIQECLDEGNFKEAKVGFGVRDKDGFCVVKKALYEGNYVNKRNKLLSDRWFSKCDNFDGKDYAVVGDNFSISKSSNYKYNLISKSGKLMFDTWYYKVDYYGGNIARVTLEDIGSFTYNFIIIPTGKLLSPDLWFDECSNYFEEGFASVKIKNKGWNYINEKGSIVFDNWFYSVETFYKGFAIVEDIDKGWNIINICGNIMSDSWFNTRNDANIFLLKLYSKDFEKYNFNFVWRFLANIDKKFYEFDDNQYGIQSIKIDYEANPKIVINRKEKKFLPYNIELAEVIELIKNVLNMNENGK